MERVIDRFDAYMASMGLNDNKVTVQLNLTNGLIGKSRKPGRDLSRAVVEKILAHYPNLNGVWLQTGKGEMLVSLQEPENPVEIEPDVVFIKNRLMTHIEEQSATIKSLLDLLKAEREKTERLEEELRTYREHKGETAPAAAASSDARAV